MKSKVEEQDIDILRLPVSVQRKDSELTVMVSTGTKVMYTNKYGETETLMPVVSFKYREERGHVIIL
ncbi:hypothetical protein CMU19_04355 [Elizabethkingia anophelis]|nr:hypothetical protein [Elizabethkingia anophelis]